MRREEKEKKKKRVEKRKKTYVLDAESQSRLVSPETEKENIIMTKN